MILISKNPAADKEKPTNWEERMKKQGRSGEKSGTKRRNLSKVKVKGLKPLKQRFKTF